MSAAARQPKTFYNCLNFERGHLRPKVDRFCCISSRKEFVSRVLDQFDELSTVQALRLYH